MSVSITSALKLHYCITVIFSVTTVCYTLHDSFFYLFHFIVDFI